MPNFTGSDWKDAIASFVNGALNGTVDALAVAGGRLYAGGSFTNAAGIKTAFRGPWLE